MSAHLSVVIHAHAPDAGLGTQQPYTEPLLDLCEHGLLPLIHWLAQEDGDSVDAPVTLALSPVLLWQLARADTQGRIETHLEERVALAQAEVARTEAAGHHTFHHLARAVRDQARAHLERFQRAHRRDLVGALRALRDRGRLTLIPSAGTHAVLPLVEPPSLRALHVATALSDFHRHFDEAPRAFWLPECAWAPGLDHLLADGGIALTIAARGAWGPEHGPPDEDNLPPLETASGVFVLPETASLRASLLSAKGARRDHCFTRLPPPELRGRVLPLFRQGGDDAGRHPLDPEAAQRRARELGAELAERTTTRRDGTPVSRILALELDALGPSWPEGVSVLRALVEAAAVGGLSLGPLAHHLEKGGRAVVKGSPRPSSWRPDGYFATWVDEGVAWLHRRLSRLGQLWSELHNLRRRLSRPASRAFIAGTRHLLLAQASDWPAAVLGGSDVGRAAARFSHHAESAEALLGMAQTGRVDLARIDDATGTVPIFADLETLLA